MKPNNRFYAVISGVSLIVMAVAAGFAYGHVHSNLIVLNNAQANLSNFLNFKGLFTAGVVSWFIILITDVLVTWGLYKFFIQTHQLGAKITACFRLVYSAVLGFAIAQLVLVYFQLNNLQPNGQEVLYLIQNFEKYWPFGLIIFGFHLVGLGFLSFKSGSVPKWMAVLLYFAGVSYIVVHAAKAAAPQLLPVIQTVEMALSVPMAVAELGLAVWLIMKGGK